MRIERAQRAKLQDEFKDLSGPEVSSSTKITKHLSLSAEDARISHVSHEKVQNMWEKAQQLLSVCGLVLPAAGAVNTA